MASPQPLWENGPRLKQVPGVFPMGTDSILLADFSAPAPRDRILDLGTGSGILPLLLLYDRAGVRATALELDANACALARKNLEANGLGQRSTVIQGDLRAYREILAPGAFDLTVSNPPYFSAGSGRRAGAGMEHARSDETCSLTELCEAAAWATRWGGRFTLVFRPERLCDLLDALRRTGFEPKRLCPVHHTQTAPVNLILLDARRGGKPGLTWENDLYLYHPDGTETPALRRIYRREGKETSL